MCRRSASFPQAVGHHRLHRDRDLGGGRRAGSLIGAILGALLVNTGKSAISTARPDIWQLIMGALFVGVVLLFPKGLVGSISDGIARLRSKPGDAPVALEAVETPTVV
ncbi:hypothetical protein [Candidatus Flexifilum breve]|uniref:hypothetical protein n=1 Tax=Candidatus Flexifilum breve TaxID=3140694 RepID=UPI0031CC4127